MRSAPVKRYPDPPDSVFAIGKADCAAIWWTLKAENIDITGWEIHRFRCDGGAWNSKGYTKVPTLAKPQFIVNELAVHHEYKFGIKAISEAGISNTMSPLSNAVMIEAALPAGWFRFYSDKKKRFYYANVRTKESSWDRPEKNPYFLEASVISTFHAREITHLKALYDEEIMHFGKVTAVRFSDILYETGDYLPIGRIYRLFEAYCGNDSVLSTWKQFMDVMHHVKDTQVNPPKVILNVTGIGRILLYFQKRVVAAVMGDTTRKLGAWTVERNDFAKKDYYYNTETEETSWEMPDAVRFYLSPQLTNTLLTVFDYGHIEHFKYQFCMIDVDASGDISPGELKVLLDTMHIIIDDGTLNNLVRTIDLNGNGTIEFDEFCWMMYELQRKKKSGVFQKLETLQLDIGEQHREPDNSPNRSHVSGNASLASKTISTKPSVVTLKSPSGRKIVPMSPPPLSGMVAPAGLSVDIGTYADYDDLSVLSGNSTEYPNKNTFSPAAAQPFPPKKLMCCENENGSMQSGQKPPSFPVLDWNNAEELEGVGPALMSQCSESPRANQHPDDTMLSYVTGSANHQSAIDSFIDGDEGSRANRYVVNDGTEADISVASAHTMGSRTIGTRATLFSSSLKAGTSSVIASINTSPTVKLMRSVSARLSTAVSATGAALTGAAQESFQNMHSTMQDMMAEEKLGDTTHGAFCMCGCRCVQNQYE